MVDAVPAPGYFGEMTHPPFVVFADVAVAPLGGGDRAGNPFKVGEILAPVIALARDRGRIIPIVVAFAVRRKMDIPQRGLTGMSLLVTGKALPQIIATV